MGKRNNRLKGLVPIKDIREESKERGFRTHKPPFDEIVEFECPAYLGLKEPSGPCKRCSDCWLKARKMGWK